MPLKPLHPRLLVVIAISAAAILCSYSLDISRGMDKHTPACAPITVSTCLCVYSLCAVGIVAGVVSLVGGHSLIRFFGIIGASCCVIVGVLWTAWLVQGSLLPYDDFVAKVGMGA